MELASDRLYTTQLLALAAGLAAWPWDESLPLKGTVRSRTCGSSLDMGLSVDGRGRIRRLGLRTQACAVGQAAAALFAAGASGKDEQAITSAGTAIADWLGKDGPRPDWPGIEVLEAARHVPGRHGAIMLAWIAAREALSSV